MKGGWQEFVIMHIYNVCENLSFYLNADLATVVKALQLLLLLLDGAKS